jgi:hypothetical protein
MLAWPPAFYAGVRFGFFVFGEFWAAAKFAKHYADSPPRKLRSNLRGTSQKFSK